MVTCGEMVINVLPSGKQPPPPTLAYLSFFLLILYLNDIGKCNYPSPVSEGLNLKAKMNDLRAG